MLGFITKIACT